MLNIPTQAVATDFQDFTALRSQAKDNPDAALHEVARHFESMFIKMMLESMRQASFGDPYFDSNSSDLYRGMFDDQIALDMTRGRGIGLADMLVQQLGTDRKQISATQTSYPVAGSFSGVREERSAPPTKFSGKADFVEKLWPLADKAAQELGTTPQVILAQAALETGWGNSVQQLPNGRSSFNLFNIKADNRWDGPRVNINTLEYDGEVAHQQKAAFRVYDSYEQSFNDYVSFIKSNPRYADALKNADNPELYIRGLHTSGYATDPAYAGKVLRVMQGDELGNMQSAYMRQADSEVEG